HLEHRGRVGRRPRRRQGSRPGHGVLADGRPGPRRPPAGPAVHLRRPPGGHRHRHRPGHRHLPDRPRRAGPPDHIRVHHRVQHPDHRRPRPLRRPRRRGRPPPGRPRTPVGAVVPPRPSPPPDPAGRLKGTAVHFLGQVFDWFGDTANWSGPNGIPQLFVNQLKLSLAVVVAALVVGGGIGVILGHTGRGGLVAVNAANSARAIPTLALLTLFAIQPSISLKWSGFLASFLALLILAIPPILTNTYV